MENAIAANVLGTLGAVCWSIQLIPQIIKNYRRHNTVGLQPTMMILWSLAGLPLGVYNICKDFNLPLQIQPQILMFLSLITWSQCKYYGDSWRIPRILLTLSLIGSLLAGIEVGLVFALRHGQRRNIEWPLTLMAILSAVLLAAGVLRHYVDIYKTKSVRGLSITFVCIDAMGDLTSLLSLLFEPHIDALGFVIYGSELVLWIGVLICVFVFNVLGIGKEVESGNENEIAAV